MDFDDYTRQDPALAERLRRLLPTIGIMAELGKSPALRSSRPSAAETAPALWAGSLGDYRIGPEIGRGGMGVVYEAEQISLCRRVALKMLPFASALDPKQLKRFKNESMAAAHLHHAHIVPVYAVGCERGVHFYAMQYIDGQPLASLITELRRIESRECARSTRPDAGPFATGSRLDSAQLCNTDPDGDRSTGSGDRDDPIRAGITTRRRSAAFSPHRRVL